MKEEKGNGFLQHLKDMIKLHRIVMSGCSGEGNLGIGGRKDEDSKRTKK